ncbi:bifunctional solanapyrone synthase [Chaetomidium leptoderma]|uniref:Bifunctional solanapyrone synthase n=1 Tax=Chaetomidium leptoderma TaxID=669021 RepID=A0AAN6VJX5_9PEZI|nr:bifunctional solanapyrone synthase [Chaetomidium leptoderma]
MAYLPLLFHALALAFAVAHAVIQGNATGVCREIDDIISESSDVVYPIQALRYTSAIQHWFLTSNDKPACVVEPGSPEDVALVLQIVGASRTPFAVYCGGHASNPGFSSTPGVHISLKRFDQVELSADGKIVTLGFGQGWTDVYDALEDAGVNVVGGRVPGPGTGGFTLGGGFSWKTNQYGLTCDTVKSFNVVLPNGTITVASNQQNKDLFFALKGGLNRFGIVTSAEFYTHPQPPKVWGGLRRYPVLHVPKLLNATQRFYDESKDPKTQIIVTLEGSGLGVGAMALFFHDGPEKPEIFDMFDGLLTTIDNTGSKSYKQLINSFPAQLVLNARGTFHSFSTTKLTGRYIEAVRAEAEAIGQVSALHSGTTVSYEIEPFTKYGVHATESAFPHADSLLPLNLYYAWLNPLEDDWWYAKIRQSLATLKQVAKDEGIYEDGFPAYGNYAVAGTSTEELYGAQNAARLRVIRDKIDPDRIMDLGGGFEI